MDKGILASHILLSQKLDPIETRVPPLFIKYVHVWWKNSFLLSFLLFSISFRIWAMFSFYHAF
jgi:hypothetical protein